MIPRYLLVFVFFIFFVLWAIQTFRHKTPFEHGQSQEAYENHTKVVIVGYWKSGSSFTGELLAQYPNTYYTYEPLHVLQNKDNNHRPIIASQRDQVLFNTFDCDFSNASLHEFVKLYKLCKVDATENCSSVHAAKCQQADLRLMKTVRLRLNQMETLFEKYPNLKVILLMRNPQKILASRLNKNWCGSSTASNCSNIEALCQDMTNDLKIGQMYPASIHIVKYEDIDQDPLSEMQKIADFLGLAKANEFEKNLKFYLDVHSKRNFKPLLSMAEGLVANNGEYNSKYTYKRLPSGRPLNAKLVGELRSKCRYIFQELY